MRATHVALVGLVVGCTHHAPATTQPASGEHEVSGRIVYVSADSLRRLRAAQPPEDPRFTAWRAREDSLAALVDTIVVLSPDSILLHLGQAVDILRLIKTEGRRASGEVVPSFPEFRAVEDMSIAQPREAGLTGLNVGRTRVILTIMSRRGHAPPSYVPVRVVP